jgi:hypothetical protein
MTISPKTRDLAQQLLIYEANAGKNSTPTESLTLCTYEKLRQCLVSFAGVASFQSIAVRALVLAQAEVPGLCAVHISAEGSLQGLGDVEFQTILDKDLPASQKAGEDPPGEAEVILVACILGLLLTLLGEALTLSLLRNAWPNAILDDRNSGNRRKA